MILAGILAVIVVVGCVEGVEENCVDFDHDRRGVNCSLGTDQDDRNPNLWSETASCVDADGDGFYSGCDVYVTVVEDCDDSNRFTHAGAPELGCDLADNNCDGNVNEPEVVVFADPNLESKVRAAIPKLEGDLLNSDFCFLTVLDARASNVSDLGGLEYATALETLYLHDNQLSDISALAGLTSLNYLGLNNNQISDLSPLAGLTSLLGIEIYSNQISDISALAGLTGLHYVIIYANQISDISVLVAFPWGFGGDMLLVEDNLLDEDDCGDIKILAGKVALFCYGPQASGPLSCP